MDGNPRTRSTDQKLEDLYTELSSGNKKLVQTIAQNYEHDPQLWSQTFSAATSCDPVNKSVISSLRRVIQNQTITYASNYSYCNEENQKVAFSKPLVTQQAKDTIFYPECPAFPPRDLLNQQCQIQVLEGDCLNIALGLHEKGLKPVVLNMACNTNPGGGYKAGSGAQEEDLFRRTNYFQSLEDPQRLDDQRTWKYPIPEFGAIYSPSVLVFRGGQKTGYQLLSAPISLSFIAVPAYKGVKTIQDGGKHPKFNNTQREGTKKKIEAILKIPLLHQNDSIVLSAFGCGAYRNPPYHMAQLFKEVIEEGNFSNMYKEIVFAIFDDHNAKKLHNPDGNLLPFQAILVNGEHFS